jgi:hypothetical protein
MVLGKRRKPQVVLGGCFKIEEITLIRKLSFSRSFALLLMFSLSFSSASSRNLNYAKESTFNQFDLIKIVKNRPKEAEGYVCSENGKPDIYDEKNGYFATFITLGTCEVIIWQSQYIKGVIVVFNKFRPNSTNDNPSWREQDYLAYLYDGKWSKINQAFLPIPHAVALTLYKRFKSPKSPNANFTKSEYNLFLDFPRYGHDVNVYFDVSADSETLIGSYVFSKGKFAFVPRR